MATQVMVDLETLGSGSNAVILSIGAVEFNPDTQALGREFYIVVEPQSCVDAGLAVDVGTVMWWMKQSDQARAAFDRKGWRLEDALDQFAEWFPAKATLWGNGATFDNVILANAYKATGKEQPWAFWNDRCYRTLKNLLPGITLDRKGTYHNALDDAKTQALHANKLLAALAN
jgi:hypothetical protein